MHFAEVPLKFYAPAELLHDILLFTSREEVELCKFISKYWKATLLNLKSELPYQAINELSIKDDPVEVLATIEGQFSRSITVQNSNRIFENSVVSKMILSVKNSMSMEKVLEILKSAKKRIKTCIIHELWNRAEFYPLHITFFNEIVDPTYVNYTCQNFRPVLWVLKTTNPTLVNTLPSSVTLDMEIPINNADQGALMEFLKDGQIVVQKRKITLNEGKRIEMDFCHVFMENFLTSSTHEKFFKTVIWSKNHHGRFQPEPRWNLMASKNNIEKYVIYRKDANKKLDIIVEKYSDNPNKIIVKFYLRDIKSI